MSSRSNIRRSLAPTPFISPPGIRVSANDKVTSSKNNISEEETHKQWTTYMVNILKERQPDLFREFGESLLMPKPVEDREGGYIGQRWKPSCGPYQRRSCDWLDFVYWDVKQSVTNYRIYNFQVCVKGAPPTKPFDYIKEGVVVKMLNIARRPVRALAHDNPETYVGGSGDTFVITYPELRGKPRGKRVTVRVRLPIEVVPGEALIQL